MEFKSNQMIGGMLNFQDRNEGRMNGHHVVGLMLKLQMFENEYLNVQNEKQIMIFVYFSFWQLFHWNQKPLYVATISQEVFHYAGYVTVLNS